MRHTTVTMPGLSDADIAEAIDAATQPATNADPSWKTAEQWAAAWGCNIEHARRRCRRGEQAKLMEPKKLRAVAGARSLSMVHWKFVGQPKQPKRR